MQLRAPHTEHSIKVLRQLIRAHPLGLVTTAIPSDKYNFLQTSHIPLLLDLKDETSETELGTLRGHMARANPQSKAMVDALTANPTPDNVLEQDVLVMFTESTQGYITPKFYTETKPVTGKVVPTWNYAAVQVYGRAKIYFDSKSPETTSFLQKAVSDLSNYGEVNVMGYNGKDAPDPWTVEEAPESYINQMIKAIIGIEITVKSMEGKFKMSQEATLGDREGVIKGFSAIQTDMAQNMAKIVKERGELKDAEKAT